MTDSPAMQAAIKAVQGQARKTAEELIEARAQAYMKNPEQLDLLDKANFQGKPISQLTVEAALEVVRVKFLYSAQTRRAFGGETILINLKAAARMLARLGDTDLPVREAVTREKHREKCIEAIKLALQDQACIDLHGDDYWNHQANAAFDALHGIARVTPIEATYRMLVEGDVCSTTSGQWCAMSAAGDLTNPPKAKP